MAKETGSHSFWRWVALALGTGGAIAVLWSVLPLGSWMAAGTQRIAEFGWAAVPVFIGVYVLLAICGFPSTPLNVAAGVLFGYTTATLSAVVAAFLAAMATFFIARYVARDWVCRRIERKPGARSRLRLIEHGGFKIVALARLNPFIPAVVKSYAFGVTEIPTGQYALATLAGQFPVILVHVYLGWAGLAMLDGSAIDDRTHGVLLTAGIVVSLTLLIVISWYGHRLLNRQDGAAERPASTA